MAPKVAEKAVKAPATKAPAAKKVVKKTAKSGASKKKTKGRRVLQDLYLQGPETGAYWPCEAFFSFEGMLDLTRTFQALACAFVVPAALVCQCYC